MYFSDKTPVLFGLFLYQVDTKLAVPCANLAPNRVQRVCQFFLIVPQIQLAHYRPDPLRRKRSRRFWYERTD